MFKTSRAALPDEEPSLGGLVGSLLGAMLETIRRNRLAAILAAVTCLAGSFLAVFIQYDERPHYREVILPDIRQAEERFQTLIAAAEDPATADWGLNYFLAAHRRANDVLQAANRRWPRTADGVAAHGDLILYYQLVSEEMAIIRTEMSLNEAYDYRGAWKNRHAALEPIRQRWIAWMGDREP